MHGETGLRAQGVAAVVFDWAGTIIDFGSHAPMGAFVELFASEGIAISIDEARIPMGMPKWDHIKALGLQPRIAAAWLSAKGAAFSDADVDRLYTIFTPMNIAALPRHATLISGVVPMTAGLRQQGIRVGSTTGYNREIMAVLAPLAEAQGFTPDNLVCAGDLPENRPSPLGMYRCFLDLGVWPAHRVVKIDDTVPGLMEGRHAGCWTVGVLASGNEVGLTEAQWQALGADEQGRLREKARSRLLEASPDFWVDTVAELPGVIARIDALLAEGAQPAPLPRQAGS
jgi:phosphonoacetaldehyde hydrolase